MKPTISVIIPTYNRQNFIIEAVESVLSQTYSNYEIIVIDDGSMDNTRDLLTPYIIKNQIKYTYQDNAGVSAARNAGLEVAKGEWVAYLDSDDLWLPHKLERQLRIINSSATEIGCVICNSRYDRPIGKTSFSFQDANFHPLHPQGICFNIKQILLTRFILFSQCAMIKKKYLDEIGGYNESLEFLEDYDLALKLSFICEWGYDTNPQVVYRRNPSSISKKFCFMHKTKTIYKIYVDLERFLNTRNIQIPVQLHWQINFHSLIGKLEYPSLAKLVSRFYKYGLRYLPSCSNPRTEKIEIEVDNS